MSAGKAKNLTSAWCQDFFMILKPDVRFEDNKNKIAIIRGASESDSNTGKSRYNLFFYLIILIHNNIIDRI